MLINNCKVDEKVEISLLTSEHIAPLFASDKNYANILKYDGKNAEYLNKEIKRNAYDIVLDLQKNKISEKLLLGYEGDLRKVNKFRKEKLEMVYLKKFPKKIVHVADRYLDTCRDMIKDDGRGLQLVLANTGLDAIRNSEIKIVGIAPEAYHYTKRWLPERYLQLVERLIGAGYEVRIFGKDRETLPVEGLQVKNFFGQLDLLGTAQEIAQCDMFISNDTGLMHIASALGLPILLIFGSSVKELGFTPYRTNYELIEYDIWCRPCSHIGRSFCPLGHFKCMKEITVDEVYNRFLQFKSSLENNS
jgi:heptosyltransferase-2